MMRRVALGLLSAVNVPLKPLGVQLARNRQTEATADRRISHLARTGFRPRVALDGGAFSGEWSREVAHVFAGCRPIVVEPNPEMMQVARRRLAGMVPSPHFAEVALGPETGTAQLHLWSGSSGAAASLLDHVSGPATKLVEVPVRRMDDIAAEAGAMPDLIKLDLQGFEVPALRGAGRCLEHAEVAILEIGCLRAYVGRSSPREVVDAMYDAGFVLHDIFELGYRPYDGALTGADFVFVKGSSPLRAHAGYR
jgi:FkbM family methyltransferase